MCQLNVYVVPKSVTEEQVKKCFENINIVSNITQEFNIEALKKYNFYSYTYTCNCGSLISRLAESEDAEQYDSYSAYTKNECMEKLNKLYAIKALQQDPDYKKKFDEYFNERERLFMAYLEASEHLTPDINEHDTPEYLAFSKYMEDNPLLEDSSVYPLVPDEDFPFNTVDEEIEQVEKNLALIDQESEEFKELKKTLSKLLQISPEVKIFAYWMSGNNPTILQKGQRIKLEELNELILAKLPYEKLLTITN